MKWVVASVKSAKRPMALILLAAVCVLALAMALTLSGCGGQTGGTEGDVDEMEDLPQVSGVTAAYTSGYVDMALTIPEGWRWEAVQPDDQTEGVRFWKEDDRTLDFTLLCWTQDFGLCATGVSSQEVILPSGLTLWQYTEKIGDTLWVNLCVQDTPGSYVLQPTSSITAETWEACREELLSILNTAQFGRGIMTEQQAIDAASAVYGEMYDMAYGSFDVKTGVWTVRFSRGTTGTAAQIFTVSASGAVSAGT